MTRKQIKDMLTEMDFLLTGEMEALAELIFHAMKNEPGAREKAATVLNWLYAADRIELKDKMDLMDLFY